MQQAKNFLREFIIVIVLALVIVVPIRVFIAQPFVVSGESMDNTFQNGNYLVINEFAYDFSQPQRGDVIIFKAPPAALALENIKTTATVYYIKRIIGLPGETVQIDGDKVTIYNAQNPEGFVLNEPYTTIELSENPSFANIHEKVTLTSDEYFVMGDNRRNSSDSRFWGPVTRSEIKGKTMLRLFPFNEITVDPGDYSGYATTTMTISTTTTATTSIAH